jgi:hypothetical protein
MERTRLLQSTIVEARKTAGGEFHWLACSSGAGPEARQYLDVAHDTKLVDEVKHWDENVGQHVAWNYAYEQAKTAGADYFLRIDDDCHFISKRWLAKILEFSQLVDDRMIISPTVRGLKHPPETSSLCVVMGQPVEFLREAIGGVCRLHPMDRIEAYSADVRKPLGSGDATGMALYCKDNTIPMVYLKRVRVRHTTKVQEGADPSHFSEHEMCQSIPYIPIIRGTDENTTAHQKP